MAGLVRPLKDSDSTFFDVGVFANVTVHSSPTWNMDQTVHQVNVRTSGSTVYHMADNLGPCIYLYTRWNEWNKQRFWINGKDGGWLCFIAYYTVERWVGFSRACWKTNDGWSNRIENTSTVRQRFWISVDYDDIQCIYISVSNTQKTSMHTYKTMYWNLSDYRSKIFFEMLEYGSQIFFLKMQTIVSLVPQDLIRTWNICYLNCWNWKIQKHEQGVGIQRWVAFSSHPLTCLFAPFMPPFFPLPPLYAILNLLRQLLPKYIRVYYHFLDNILFCEKLLRWGSSRRIGYFCS